MLPCRKVLKCRFMSDGCPVFQARRALPAATEVEAEINEQKDTDVASRRCGCVETKP